MRAAADAAADIRSFCYKSCAKSPPLFSFSQLGHFLVLPLYLHDDELVYYCFKPVAYTILDSSPQTTKLSSPRGGVHYIRCNFRGGGGGNFTT